MFQAFFTDTIYIHLPKKVIIWLSVIFFNKINNIFRFQKIGKIVIDKIDCLKIGRKIYEL